MKENTFAKNVATLMVGTGAAQAITFLLAFIVTRLYTPEDFTTLEHYAMILSVLSVFSTFKMELAIIQADNENKAKAIAKWTLRTSLVVSVIVFVLILLFGQSVANYFQNPLIYWFLYLIPLNLFLVGAYQVLVYWHHRNKDFKYSSVSKFLFNLSNDGLRIGLGSLGVKPGGLIFGNLGARLISVLYLLKKGIKGFKLSGIARNEEKEAITEFSEFYKFSVWGSFFGKLSVWAHVFLFSHFFGLWSIGFFALSRRLVLSPLSIFSQSFSQVFYQEISSITDVDKIRKLFFKFFYRISALAALMILVVNLIPNSFYGWALGDKWELLGDFMRLLIFWFGLNFITSCLSFISYRLKKQRQMFFLDSVHLIIVLSSICIGYYSGKSEWQTLEYFVIGKVIFFAINLTAMIYFVLTSTKFKHE